MIQYAFKATISVLALFISASSFADIGNCVRYKVELQVAGQNMLEGFMQIISYDPLIVPDGQQLLDRIKNRHARTLRLYKTIHTINYPGIEPNPYNFLFSAAPSQDIVDVPINTVNKINVSAVQRCEQGIFPNKPGKDNFLIHYNAHIIGELTGLEIKSLQNRPYASFVCEKTIAEANSQTTYMLSYNPDINTMKLKTICQSLFVKPPSGTQWTTELAQKRERHYGMQKQQLREKSVVMFTIQWAL